MIQLGMHTDNWRVLSGSFQTAIDAAVKYHLSHIEFGVIHGQYWVNALGYEPAVSLQSNPRTLRRYLDGRGLRVSQIDAAFPLMGPEGSTFGVQYVQQAIRFAAELGCPIVDTTDVPAKSRAVTTKKSSALRVRTIANVSRGQRITTSFSMSRRTARTPPTATFSNVSLPILTRSTSGSTSIRATRSFQATTRWSFSSGFASICLTSTRRT